uniref:Poly [ADP-ribose] polymerase n=1 Tax=Gouania willdenowi TaxID=441366 RepID=A0A8C5DZM1_GOUWI
MSHKLEGVDLLVKPYFGFLLPKQLPTSEQCEKEIQDDTVMNSVHPNDFQTEVSHSTETSYCARDQKAVEVLGAFEVVDEVTQDIIEETVDTDAQQSHNAITNPAEQSLDPCCTVQQDLKEVSLNIAIKIKDNGVHSTQSEQKTVKQLANIPPDFVENMVSVILNVKPEMLHFLTQTDVKEWFIENMDQSCSPTTYTVLDSSLVVTAPSKDAAQQACWFLDSQACHFSVPVEAECQYILYCSEWTEFLHTLSCCSVTVSEQGENLLIWTLKEKENENQAAIQNFLTMPIEREMVIPMEPGMLKYIQTHCHQLLADMAQVSIFPLEGDYVHGLKIHGLAVACQTAEELLQGVVSSILSRTITVNAPGVTRFLREKECESILKEMETKFQCVSSSEHSNDIDDLDLYTADSPTGPIAQADIDVIEDSLLLAKDSSASGSTSLRDGGPNLSCYLDEEVQLSLAIQYSLDSSNWSQDDEDEQLQKALDLSNKMSQCDSVSVKNFEENLLQDNISSRFNNAVCAANVVKLVVFAGYREYSLLSNFPEAIKLDVVSDEFQNVVKNFYSTLHEYNNRIRIVQVEKLSNRLLYNQYNLKKASIKKNASYPEIERTLYHGTSETCVKEICTHGFNRSFCGKNATVYGQGVYFAVDSALSVQDKYSPPNNNGYKFVLVSKVLTGDYTKGCHSMKTAPLKETGIIPLRYDSVTDEINKPTLFVIFNDTQAFPEYLITCQRIFMS